MDLSKIEHMLFLHHGYCQYPYVNDVGDVIIGIGSNLTSKGFDMEMANKFWPDGQSLEDSRVCLKRDIENTIESLERNLKFFKSLDEVRKSALVDIAFALQIKRLAAYNDFLELISKSKYSKAATSNIFSIFPFSNEHHGSSLRYMIAYGKWSLTE